MIFRILGLVALAAALFQASCSPIGDDPVQDGAVGAAVGTGVGAGTGALIGNAMAHGDVAKSTLIGGAIGLPVGLAGGVALSYYTREQAISANQALIDSNAAKIRRQELDLEAVRYELRLDEPDVNPDSYQSQYKFLGQKLGNPYR